MSLSSSIRGRLPASTSRRLRPLNRFRWIEKTAQARRYRDGRSRDVGRIARYVLWDPEVGDFTYDLANRHAFALAVGEALEVDLKQVLCWFGELESHPEVAEGLAGRLRRRWDLPRRPMFGPRLGWYALVRASRPRLVVETGVKHGIGALALLLALEANAAEGHEGRLVSVDDDPASGSLVPRDRFPAWTRIVGRSPEALERHLTGGKVDVLIHDTPPIPELEAAEYELALRHGGDRVWLVSGSNGEQTGVLRGLAERHGASYHIAREIPDHPIYGGQAMVLSRVVRPS